MPRLCPEPSTFDRWNDPATGLEVRSRFNFQLAQPAAIPVIASKREAWINVFIDMLSPFGSLEKWLRFAQHVRLFLGPAPVAGLGFLDDLLEVFVAVVGELARGMSIGNPLDILGQLFLILERDGRQQGLELAAILELPLRRLPTAGDIINSPPSKDFRPCPDPPPFVASSRSQ